MIKPPAWQKDAVPTLVGWKHPRRNELLLPKKMTQAQIDEYLGVKSEPAPAPAPTPVAAVEVDEDDLDSMSKMELEALGREHGVELDRRQKKATLVERMKGLLSSK